MYKFASVFVYFQLHIFDVCWLLFFLHLSYLFWVYFKFAEQRYVRM